MKLRYIGESFGVESLAIKQYDTVILKDGREAAIVEVFGDKDFLADVGDSPSDWETISITIDQIERILKRNKL